MQTQMDLNTVKVPEPFADLFLQAQEYVSQYFQQKSENPSQGTIEVFDQRYILVRGASLSVDLFELMIERYQDAGEEEAIDVARSFLFDIAHTIGKMDARNFASKMDLKDPIERLSAGPVHFSHTGWAFVDISPESRPSPDEDFYLLYDHPFSFESDAWMQAGKQASFPVCVMNAGYSSGWCEESFGVPLLATEITCKARGDDACRFIMGHPDKIEGHIQRYLQQEPEIERRVTDYQIPDLSKRKRVEETLRITQEENRKLATVASCTHSSVMILTPGGDIEWVNDGFARMNECSLKDVLGRKPEDVLTYQSADPPFGQWVKTQVQNHTGGRQEFARRTPFGSLLWLDVEVQPIFNEQQTLTSIVVIESNITESKEAEARQRQLLSEIEQVNRELKDFAHIVSHDLKAPLRGIKNLVLWLSEDCQDTLDAEHQEQMSLLNGRVDRMQMLIDGILQYSRVGCLQEERVSIDLQAVVAEAVDILAPPAHITVTMAEDLPTIVGEPTPIMQVVQNLLSNAIKYSDKPQGQISVDSTTFPDRWEFRVTDNGPGIESKHFDTIFEMFKTLNPRDQFESTGVGLTLVKKIIEQAGGTIRVESTLGQGSTFIVCLPRSRESKH
ncbi:ATP-binding protein [Planctomycetota bacterium]